MKVMKKKLLPVSIGTYRIINKAELTPEQRNMLRAAGGRHIMERLCALIGDGKVSVSQVQERYGALMREVGGA
jgi:hypothetical protein